MQKVYLSKTRNGIYGLFTDHILVLELSEYHYNQYRNNPEIYYSQCRSMHFDCTDDVLYLSGNTLLKQAQYLNTFDKIKAELKPLKKIYFTVKTDQTYYFESNCQDRLFHDLLSIENEIGSIKDHVTFSNRLPKSILI